MPSRTHEAIKEQLILSGNKISLMSIKRSFASYSIFSCYFCSFSFINVRSIKNILQIQIHLKVRSQKTDSYLRKNLINLFGSSFTQSQCPSTWICFQLKIALWKKKKRTGYCSINIPESTMYPYNNQLSNIWYCSQG